MLSFTFNGISSESFNILIEDSNIYSKGKKRIEFIQVPGRTGDLIIYDNSRKNITIELECSIEVDLKDKPQLLKDLDDWLNGPEGYKDLIFNNGIKYKGVFIGELNLPTTESFYTDFKLEFSCYQE